MKKRIRDYIDLIFADAPDCVKIRELKDEMYANVCDRYDDLIKEGKSESAAYNISISGIGDISEIIDSLKSERGDERTVSSNPYADGKYHAERTYTEKETAEIESYRKKRGIMNSIAIALYILCWVPLVIIASAADVLGGNDDIAGTVGICIMMLMIAAATILMIMKSSIKPLCLNDVKDSELDGENDDGEDSPKNAKRRKNPLLKAISGALWVGTVCIYLGVSFLSGAWHITWIVYLIAVAIDNIIDAIFEICGKKYA